jgi:hypothetical protein
MLRWMCVCLVVLLGCCSSVSAGQFTVTVDDAVLKAYMQDQALVASRGATAAPKQTPQQAVQGFVDRALAATKGASERNAVCAKLTSAAEKQAMGCPLPIPTAPAAPAKK